MTLVTHHPLYVKGGFNWKDGTDHPAALIADSFTMLSGNWNDANSTLPTVNRPGQEEYALRAAIMAGRARVPGGEETVLRLLEYWDERDIWFNGSEISLWESEEAGSDLAPGSFVAPESFSWNFDIGFTNLATLPPKTPVAYSVTSIGWYEP
jgi:hypothetical protein